MKMINTLVYGSLFMVLLAVDYIFGNGLIFGTRSAFCKVICMMRKMMKQEVPVVTSDSVVEPPNMLMFFAELCVLVATMLILNRYKNCQGKDKLDELLQESKDALQQTNDFLEKWKLRRMPTEYSYLDEEPQQIKPLKLEVPILHMAIVDTRGTSRKLERGDAGDTINYTDSTILSVSSILDDDLDESVSEHAAEGERIEEVKNIEFKNRCLWDVLEEDQLIVGEYE